MLPIELNVNIETQTDEYSDKYSAVLFTGNSLRHKRFGYLIQQAYPGLVKAWFTTVPKKLGKKEKISKALSKVLPVDNHGNKASSRELIHKALKKGMGKNIKYVTNAIQGQLLRLNYPKEEKMMFGWEVEILSKSAEIHPTSIEQPNSENTIIELNKISPYLLLTFGGPLLGKRVLDSVRGYCINQHAGYSPDLKGANTTEMAIYHRKIDRIGSTVHFMDVYADAGPILRRSLATIHPDDKTGNCFLAVTALGNHLMIETIEKIFKSDKFYTFEQGIGKGETILNTDLTTYRKKVIREDHGKMFNAELANLRDF